MPNDIADLRIDYGPQGLRVADLASTPIEQFQRWFALALQTDLVEANAMTLSTVNAAGRPSARVVLLKGVDEAGFVFFTNYNSQKGQDLAHQPYAALTFWWDKLFKQVRIEGLVEKVSTEESSTYFQSRPRDSQLGAWISTQSELIPNRQVLEERQTRLEAQYAHKSIPRPSYWGGYRLKPELVEFWQGRSSRLHDRLCYRLQADGSWEIVRLSP